MLATTYRYFPCGTQQSDNPSQKECKNIHRLVHLRQITISIAHEEEIHIFQTVIIKTNNFRFLDSRIQWIITLIVSAHESTNGLHVLEGVHPGGVEHGFGWGGGRLRRWVVREPKPWAAAAVVVWSHQFTVSTERIISSTSAKAWETTAPYFSRRSSTARSVDILTM